ncbi:MAG: DUF5916 domain-containing protein [Fimbriimonadaceae bacterium]
MTSTYRALTLVVLAMSSLIYADSTSGVAGRDEYELPGIKATNTPEIDGVIGDGEWPAEARREGFTDADTNLKSDELGEFWLTYDENFIYFAGRATTNPNKIVDDEYRDNVSLRGNDNFSLLIDPFGASTNFNSFGTNASGATEIGLSGGRAAKTEWLGEILAAGRKTDTGWECEMRIPWALMSVPAAGVHNPRFNVRWYRSNKSNTYTYRYTNNDSSLTPIWSSVEIPKVDRSQSISFLPYVTGGVQEGEKSIFNSGVDFKTTVNENMQLVGTINPDFRNIENDVLNLDFSRFERLAGENRAFFQEGSRYRILGFSQRLFASQRIQRFDTGLNDYGQVNENSTLGALFTIDYDDQIASAVSYTYRPTSERSIRIGHVGNLQSGQNNNAFLLDFSDQKGEMFYFVNSQFTDDEITKSGFRNSSGVGIQRAGFNAMAEFNVVTPNFNPRIGFSSEQDLIGFGGNAEWEFTPETGPFNGYNYGIGFGSYDRPDGAFYRNQFEVGAEAQFRNKLGIGVGAEFSNFEGSADHLYLDWSRLPERRPYRNINVSYDVGEFEGDRFESVSLRGAIAPPSECSFPSGHNSANTGWKQPARSHRSIRCR